MISPLEDYLTQELTRFYRGLPKDQYDGRKPSTRIESHVEVMKEADFVKTQRPIGKMVGGGNSNTNSNARGPG